MEEEIQQLREMIQQLRADNEQLRQERAARQVSDFAGLSTGTVENVQPNPGVGSGAAAPE